MTSASTAARLTFTGALVGWSYWSTSSPPTGLWRTARRRRIQCMQRSFQGLPVHQLVQPIQKVIGRNRHEAIHQSKLRGGFGVQAPL